MNVTVSVTVNYSAKSAPVVQFFISFIRRAKVQVHYTVKKVIPKKASKHSQSSIAQPERDRHKAYFSIKPIEWDKEKTKKSNANLLT